MAIFRCKWCSDDPLYIHYHDTEWGVPVHDDRHLFEMLILEGAQAGLSWITVLKKRDSYRNAFDNFDIHAVSNYDQQKIDKLLGNPGIIRNKLKINAAIKNARAVIDIQKEFGTFDAYIWKWVDNAPIINTYKTLTDIPVQTEISEQLSKDLKKRGMSFVGPTIIYAFMQAIGMVNDHETGCFRYNELI